MNSKFLILLFTISLMSCNSSKPKEEVKSEEKSVATLKTTVSITKEQYNSIGLETGKVEMRNLSSMLKTNGKLTLPPQNKADVSLLVGGIVETIKVVEGDFVKKGQTLALIESTEFLQAQQDYLENNITLPSFESEYQRQLNLQNDNINSKKTFQQAEVNYKSAL